jgi:hypothetical protein
MENELACFHLVVFELERTLRQLVLEPHRTLDVLEVLEVREAVD